jgi:PIN domain nuclease of toxin-antitoxin system
VRILLDTHLFLWTLDDSPKLSQSARELMTAPETDCFVSAVSFWEIAIKAALRRKDFRIDTTALVHAADVAGLKHLPFVAAHAVHVATLPRHHPDPFDRALLPKRSWSR